jgi:hypothetical protein
MSFSRFDTKNRMIQLVVHIDFWEMHWWQKLDHWFSSYLLHTYTCVHLEDDGRIMWYSGFEDPFIPSTEKVYVGYIALDKWTHEWMPRLQKQITENNRSSFISEREHKSITISRDRHTIYKEQGKGCSWCIDNENEAWLIDEMFKLLTFYSEREYQETQFVWELLV